MLSPRTFWTFAREFSPLEGSKLRLRDSDSDPGPEAGNIIPATGGFRKLRWAHPKRHKGKRGGLRIIYYYFGMDAQIWLVTLYGKNDVADLSPTEKHTLKAAIGEEARQRAARRTTRRK